MKCHVFVGISRKTTSPLPIDEAVQLMLKLRKDGHTHIGLEVAR